MKREFSAGGVVFNQNKEVLLTQNSSNHYWGFPKGKIEEKEGSQEAAMREVKEESGVEAQVLKKVGDSKYVYTWEGEKIFKIVTVFLMKYISGNPKDHDWEVLEAGWFTPEKALKKLSFSQDKKLLQKALELVDER